MPPHAHPRWTLSLAAGIPLAVCCALWWPIPIHLDTWHMHTAFADSHVWVFDRLARGLTGELSLADCMAGFPTEQTMRAIGWAPGLVAILLRPLLGALGAANAVQLLSLPASALAATLLVRRTTEVDPVVAALLGAAYGLCPTLLGTFATGEISNTQAWILPALLLALHAVRHGSWPALGTVLAVGLISPFTSPYYALALPFVGGDYLLGGLRSAPERSRSLAALVVLAVSLLPAWPYYGGDAAGGRASLFRPARAQSVVPVDTSPPVPVAQPETLLWHTAPAPGSDVETLHVTALGVALILLALPAIWRARRNTGWALGLGLRGRSPGCPGASALRRRPAAGARQHRPSPSSRSARGTGLAHKAGRPVFSIRRDRRAGTGSAGRALASRSSARSLDRRCRALPAHRRRGLRQWPME